MKQHDEDILDATFRLLIALTPGFSEAIIKQVDQEIRDQFGGERVYVAKRTNTRRLGPQERQAIYQDGLSTMSTSAVCEKHQIDRSTLYRHLKKGKP